MVTGGYSGISVCHKVAIYHSYILQWTKVLFVDIVIVAFRFVCARHDFDIW